MTRSGRLAAVICAMFVVVTAAGAVAKPPRNVAVTPNKPRAFQSPSLALDPVRKGNMAIAFQEGIDIKTCYLALSRDRGRRWRTVALAGRGARFPLAEDAVCWKPVLAYGPDGTLYYVFQDSFASRAGGRTVWIAVSRDGGRSFEPPHPVFSQPESVQNWPTIAVDQRSGRVYVAWSNLHPDTAGDPHTWTLLPGSLQVSSSTDHGGTFSQPVQPNPLHRQTTWTSLLAVGADGDLYVTYSNYPSGLDRDHPDGWSHVFGRSTDEGRSFQLQTVGAFSYGATRGPDELTPNGTFRLQTLAVGHAPGEVYMAWWDRRSGPARIQFTSSRDGGQTWKPARTVAAPRDGGERHQHRPWLALAPDGRLHLVYYDRDGLEGPQHVYAIHSDDGGASFSKPRRLTRVASDSRVGPSGETPGGHASFGDFPGVAASRRRLFAAWTDSRRGTRLTAKQDIYFAKLAKRR